jgi:uncharacterized protein YodC (DUF2158 family)
MAEIKAGDVVQLKSGGPTMTVNFVENDSGTLVAGCTWFIKDKKQVGRFSVTTLKLIESE